MKERDFYKMCDIVEEFGNVTDNYYPTVEELKKHDVEKNIEKFLPLLTYFSTDPFERHDLEEKFDKEYKDTVRYCKKIMYKLEIKED